MAKTVSLSEDTTRIGSTKRSGSIGKPDVKKNIIDFFGIWADRKEELEKFEKQIRGDRKRFKLRVMNF